MAKRINSRAKGAAAEREAATAIAKQFDCEARRGQQFSGSPDSPDIVSSLPIHWECKRVEKGNLYQWLEQACRDAGDKVPVVIHRRNNHEWVLVMRLKDASEFAQAVSSHAEVAAADVPGQARGADRDGSKPSVTRPTGRVVHARRHKRCD